MQKVVLSDSGLLVRLSWFSTFQMMWPLVTTNCVIIPPRITSLWSFKCSGLSPQWVNNGSSSIQLYLVSLWCFILQQNVAAAFTERNKYRKSWRIRSQCRRSRWYKGCKFYKDMTFYQWIKRNIVEFTDHKRIYISLKY